MNKSQGVTAGAILFVGALLRTSPMSVPSQIPSQPAHRMASSAPVASAKKSENDGPWKASCNYWKPGQPLSAPKAEGTPPVRDDSRLSVSVTERGAIFDSHISGFTREEDTRCNSEEWGIPRSASGLTPHVTVIIATVPDPIHSSMALEFDRSIDVLTQAAAQNGYIESYFWLPWKHALDASKSAQFITDTEAKEDLDREGQPGLLILKKSTSIPRFISPQNAESYPSSNKPPASASPGQHGHGGSGQSQKHCLTTTTLSTYSWSARPPLLASMESNSKTLSGTRRIFRRNTVLIFL